MRFVKCYFLFMDGKSENELPYAHPGAPFVLLFERDRRYGAELTQALTTAVGSVEDGAEDIVFRGWVWYNFFTEFKIHPLHFIYNTYVVPIWGTRLLFEGEAMAAYMTYWPGEQIRALKKAGDTGPIKVVLGSIHSKMPSIESVQVGISSIPSP